MHGSVVCWSNIDLINFLLKFFALELITKPFLSIKNFQTLN